MTNMPTVVEVIVSRQPEVVEVYIPGVPGRGVPRGGLEFDVLTKRDSTLDFETFWHTPDYLTPEMFDVVKNTVDSSGVNAARMNTAIAAAVSSGKILRVSAGAYGFGAPIHFLNGLRIMGQPGAVWYRDYSGPSFVSQADLFVSIQVDLDNIELRARGAETGRMFDLNLKDSVWRSPKVTRYNSGQAFIIALYDTVVYNPVIGGHNFAFGTGAFRIYAGRNSLVIGGHGNSYDDVFQFVAAANPEVGVFNLPIEDIWYIGCTGHSDGARGFIAAVDETITAPVRNCGWLECNLGGTNRSGVIFNKTGYVYPVRGYRDGSTATLGLATLTLRGFRPYSVGESIVLSQSSDPSWNRTFQIASVFDNKTAAIEIVANAAATTITRASGSFINDGFLVGQFVVIIATGTLNHRRNIRLLAVSATVLTGSGILFNETIPSAIVSNRNTLRYADGGPAGDLPEPVEIRSSGFLDGVRFADVLITRAGGSFIVDGFLVGDLIQISGGENDGSTFTIVLLSSTIIRTDRPVLSDTADDINITVISNAPGIVQRETPSELSGIKYVGVVDGQRNVFDSDVILLGPSNDTVIDASFINLQRTAIATGDRNNNPSAIKGARFNIRSGRPVVGTSTVIDLGVGDHVRIEGRVSCPTAIEAVTIKNVINPVLELTVEEIPGGIYGINVLTGKNVAGFGVRLIEEKGATTARGFRFGAATSGRLFGTDFTGLSNAFPTQLLNINATANVETYGSFGFGGVSEEVVVSAISGTKIGVEFALVNQTVPPTAGKEALNSHPFTYPSGHPARVVFIETGNPNNKIYRKSGAIGSGAWIPLGQVVPGDGTVIGYVPPQTAYIEDNNLHIINQWGDIIRLTNETDAVMASVVEETATTIGYTRIPATDPDPALIMYPTYESINTVPTAPALAVAAIDHLKHHISSGQSLMVGRSAIPVVEGHGSPVAPGIALGHTTGHPRPFGEGSANYGPLAYPWSVYTTLSDYFEATIAERDGETSGWTRFKKMQEYGVIDAATTYLMSNVAVGGKTIETLSKAGPLANIQRAIAAGFLATYRARVTYSLEGFWWRQGGANRNDTKIAHMAKMEGLRDLVKQAATRIAGQTDFTRFRFYTTVVSHASWEFLPAPEVGMAQLQVAIDYPNDFVCVGPEYVAQVAEDFLVNGLPSPDYIHLSNRGQALLGAYEAVAYRGVKQAIAANQNPRLPLHVTSATRTGTTVTLTFHNPRGTASPLVFLPGGAVGTAAWGWVTDPSAPDAGTHAAQTAQPYGVYFNQVPPVGGSVVVTPVKASFAVVDYRTITFQLSSVPTGTNQEIWIAATWPIVGQFGGPRRGPRSTIRNTADEFVTFDARTATASASAITYTYYLHDYTCPQKIPLVVV